MIDWKKFAEEHGQYMAAWEGGKLYISGPTAFHSHYAIVVDVPEKMDMKRRANWVKPVADLIETNRRDNLIPLSEIIGDALDGYAQKRIRGVMEWPQQAVDYKSWYFAKAVLRVLSLLPGAQVALGANTNCTHYLKFEGGEVVFMGLARPFEEP